MSYLTTAIVVAAGNSKRMKTNILKCALFIFASLTTNVVVGQPLFDGPYCESRTIYVKLLDENENKQDG